MFRGESSSMRAAMNDFIRVPAYALLSLCCLVSALSAATPPDPNAEACYERIACKKAFENALKATPPVDLSLVYDTGLLGDQPPKLREDRICRPSPQLWARGARVTKGWFPSDAQCGRIWKKKTGSAAGESLVPTDLPCGAYEVDDKKKKTCVASE